MKQHSLRLAAAAAASLTWTSVAIAQSTPSSVTVYGLVDMGVEVSNHGRGTLYRAISGGSAGSRLGFRGSEDLGGGLSAIFRLESGFGVDTGVLGQGGRMFGREAVVGLSSRRLGTVNLGRAQTPYYLVARAVDAFGWVGNGGTPSASRGAGSNTLQPLLVNARMDNAVRYDSPNFGGLTVRALVAAGEGSAALGHGYSVGASYASGPIDLSVGWAQQKGANGANGSIDATVIGGSYDFGVLRLYAGYNRESNDCTTCSAASAASGNLTTGTYAMGAGVQKADFRIANVGVRAPVGAGVLMAQVAQIGDKSRYAVNPGDRDALWLAVGGEYFLSKRTALYATVGTIENKNGSQYALGTGTVPLPAGAVGVNNPRAKTAAVGIRHVF